MPKPTALMITQDDSLLEAVKGIGESINSLQLEVCGTIEQAHTRLQGDEVVLALIHVARQRDEEAVAGLVWSISKSKPHCVTLVLSNEYRNQQAVAMLRAGATDYFGLPHDMKKLAYLFEVLTLRACNGGLPVSPPSEKKATLPFRTGQDAFSFILVPEIVEVMDQVRKVVAKDTTLLLTGETGTGKTRLARHIHELSPRREQPFLVVDCGALSANLVESEMFGHIKGSFTGANRDRAGKFAAVGEGTLLLDEINGLPFSLQSKLLRAVDDRIFEPVGCNKPHPLKARIIAASNVPLDLEVRAGRFRADLYYRLNVVGFYLPPLRERPSAIPPLANKFLAEFSSRNGHDIRGIGPEALRLLTDYDWPGNIRELRNVVERAVALAPGPEIQVNDLPEMLRTSDQGRPAIANTNGHSLAPLSLSQAKEEAELMRITGALLKHGNNRLRAAAELGISRMALYKKLHKYGLINSA